MNKFHQILAVRTARYAALIREHGIGAEVLPDGTLLAESTINGKSSQWIEIPPSKRQVLDWLGY